ncbi:MAG TPA: hypothetical protein VF234_02050, partial [Limnochordia bacterium]
LETCHRHGLRVMPYLTFTDMEFGASGFDEMDRLGRIEPVSEFNYRSHLMCYAAEAWQARWREEVARACERFAFDGLYIDFWAGRLACRNARHGCTGPYGRFTAAGLRQMARCARTILHSQRPEGLILANTNILPLAMINNWFDARLYGEWHNLEETDPAFLRAFYNSRRLGTGSVLLVSRVPKITGRTIALAEVFQGTPVLTHARTPAERAVLDEHARLRAAFGVSEAVGWNHFELQEPMAGVLPAEVRLSAFYHPGRREVLLALSQAAGPEVSVCLGSLLARLDEAVLRPAGFSLPERRTVRQGRGAGAVLSGAPPTAAGGDEPVTAEVLVSADDVHYVWIRADAPGA